MERDEAGQGAPAVAPIRAIVAIAILFISFAAQAEPRLTLLIGNQDYNAKVGPLKNPLRDIELAGAALEKLGFSVTKLANATKAQMDEAIRRYADQARRAGPGAISFFYYSSIIPAMATATAQLPRPGRQERKSWWPRASSCRTAGGRPG